MSALAQYMPPQFDMTQLPSFNLPLFKYEDAVKADEKCYVLDWESAPEFLEQGRGARIA